MNQSINTDSKNSKEPQQKPPKQAIYDITYMLDCIYNERTGANRNKTPKTWSLCSTVVLMNQPEQAEICHLRHDLHAGLY